MEKKKREIKVVSIEEALKRMQAFLYANMMDDHDLELENSKDEKSKYYIKLIWLAREAGDKNKVGCPCFACSYKGVLPFSDKVLNGIIYAKVFADRDFNMVKMHLVEEDREDGVNFSITPIEEGETFKMVDEAGRFVDETFIYKNGKIEKVAD